MCVHAYADVQVNACGCAQLEVCAGACESCICVRFCAWAKSMWVHAVCLLVCMHACECMWAQWVCTCLECECLECERVQCKCVKVQVRVQVQVRAVCMHVCECVCMHMCALEDT